MDPDIKEWAFKIVVLFAALTLIGITVTTFFLGTTWR